MNIQKRFILLILACWAAPSLATVVNPNVVSKITLDTNAAEHSLAKHPFSEAVEKNLVAAMTSNIDNKVTPTVFNQTQNWQTLSDIMSGTEGQENTANTENATGTHLLRFSISASQFSTGTLKIEGAGASSLYLNQAAISGTNEYSLELMNQDYRALLVVSGIEQWQDFSIAWEASDESYQGAVSFGNDKGNKRASMQQYYDSPTVGALNVSPDGELLMWSSTSYSDDGGDTPTTVHEIIELDSQKVVYRWQGMSPRLATWRDDSQALVFMHENTLYQLARNAWQLTQLSQELEDVRSIDFMNASSLLLSWHKAEEASTSASITKRYRALEDRWNYWRGNTQLHMLDLNSGLIKQVSHHRLSTNLLDLDAKNKQALISRYPIDYKAPPHSLAQLSKLDLSTGEESLIGEYRFFNTAHFHPEGIIVRAGPDFDHENANGNALSESGLANNYDGQLYLLKEQGGVNSLSRDFAPSITNIEVTANGDMVLQTTDQDKSQLYRYDFSRSAFSLIETQVEAVSAMSLSKQGRPLLVYKGSSATRPESVHMRTLRSKNDTVLFDSREHAYANVEFAALKDWDYTTESGQFIDGRVYYPPNFDSNKSYPALIYYYGGTSPVGRSFTGRWPFSLWASHGYIVYILQPSGTVGYGQDFSARHVNAWGINTADEIIESTQAFVEAHPFVDKERLGNMGASYGGFMTMYLATKTDMFAASISHAGISNLTSYWGYGWWGYGYSGMATTGSFPWSNSEFYLEQSPVYFADKINTPMLLVHGDSDTNVPVGESHQMYTALKLLDKDVELIEFLGDDHHVNKRSHRFKWWKTKLAYFDMKLKDQPLWWEHMYLKEAK